MTIKLIDLIKQGETQTCEFKISFGEESLETIGAFANAQGGKILIGVADDGTVLGTSIGRKTLENWANIIQSATDPRLQPTIHLSDDAGNKVAVIDIAPSSALPVSIRGKFLKRVGRTNQRMSHEKIMQCVLSSTGLTWDAALESSTSIHDLNLEHIQHYLNLVRRVGRRPIPDGVNETDVLEKLNLLQNGVATRAALLLFGTSPTQFFPAAYVKLGRFRSPTVIIDDKRVEGSVLKQIEECITWFRERLQTSFAITGDAQRDVRWEYPLDAVREAIVNAICHRDYRTNTNIQVRLHDNRLEIWNPGGLPPMLSADDLLRDHDSVPRNRLLADCLFYCGFIENWGSGTTRMAAILKDSGFPIPEFIADRRDRFAVVFHQERFTEEYLRSIGLREKQIRLVMLLKSGKEDITNEQYQELFSVSKRTATTDLRELIDKKVLLKHGVTGKGVRYTLPVPEWTKGQ